MGQESILILDGGMGRELHRKGAPFRQPEWSALALTEAPQIVTETHLEFIQAGADVITTNAYAVVPFHIGAARFVNEAEQLAQTAAQLAQNAVKLTNRQVKIAGSLPPLFGSYRPDLFDESQAQTIAQSLINGHKNVVDIWLAETQSSIREAVFIRELVKAQGDDRPFWVSFTLEDTHTHAEPVLRSGEKVAGAVAELLKHDVSAILFNCSQPEVMANAIKIARTQIDNVSGSQRLGVYANAFEPQGERMNDANEGLDAILQDTTPAYYLELAKQWCELGADIVGGCCGITPEHIAVLRAALK